jgi:predicted O-methyltransferase YrrM
VWLKQKAGTSFGLSTIYLALALRTLSQDPSTCRVIATENEPSKAARARRTWQEAGEGVAEYIDLREGDLLQTLKQDLPTVDLLLLDSESSSS